MAVCQTSPVSKEIWESSLSEQLFNDAGTTVWKSSFTFDIPLEIKNDKNRIIAGYASVEIVDSQGELIPIDVLKHAWDRFIGNYDFAHGQLMHTNIPMIQVLKEYVDEDGRVWKSGVDEVGLFIVAKVRDDIKKSDQTWHLIKLNKLNSFSIGGEALGRSLMCEDTCFHRIDELELHEISIVDNPANKAARFQILKSDDIVKLYPYLSAFRDSIIFKDIAIAVGSTVEKGQGHDFDVLVRLPTEMKCNECGAHIPHPLSRHLKTEIAKMFDKKGLKPAHIFAGDPEGPHSDFIPLAHIALLRARPVHRVSMALTEGQIKGAEPETVPELTSGSTLKKGDNKMSEEQKTETKENPTEEKKQETVPEPVTPEMEALKSEMTKLREELEALKAKKPKEDEEKPKDEEEMKCSDEDAFTALESLETTKGKLPKGLKDWIESHRKKKAYPKPGKEEKYPYEDKEEKRCKPPEEEEKEKKKSETPELPPEVTQLIKDVNDLKKSLTVTVDEPPKVVKETSPVVNLASMAWPDVHKLASKLGAPGRVD